MRIIKKDSYSSVTYAFVDASKTYAKFVTTYSEAGDDYIIS